MISQVIRKPIYNREQDGPDVFKWILEASQVYRELKQLERRDDMLKLSEKANFVEAIKPEKKSGKSEVKKAQGKSRAKEAGKALSS